MFRVPVRAAVHTNRPPRLVVRPHPLRETQTGSFLRTMASTESQLWAGTESAVMVWNFKDLYSPAPPQGSSSLPGDEETAPFRESVSTSTVPCLVGDEANGVVWSGYRDGRIRCWKIGSAEITASSSSSSSFKEILYWLAHRGPVLSIVMSCYGDLWSGSEGGAIKIWSSEAIEKALTLTVEERHMSALLVERAYIDPWTEVAFNGFTNIFTSDVRYLLSHDSLISWLGSVASDVGIVVVGLQEVEMGAGFLAMSATKETEGKIKVRKLLLRCT